MQTVRLLSSARAVHLLRSGDKTFERKKVSIVVQSMVWAAALDWLQRNMQTERGILSKHFFLKVVQSGTLESKWRERERGEFPS